MPEKYYKSLILLMFAILIAFSYSCSDYSPVDTSGTPVINDHSPEIAVSGDDLKLVGAYFGDINPMNRLIINDTTIINSEDCKFWSSSIIQVELPRLLSEVSFKVEVGTETSTEYKINLRLYPEIEMVDIPSGSFMMGSDRGLNNELPVHQVTLTRDYQISKYEVDQRTYEIVMGINNSVEVNEFLPADSITWMAAIEFCNALSELDGLEAAYEIDGENVTFDYDADGWRLPTEAEWEYACRAGSDGLFAGTGELMEMGWFNGNSGFKLHKPGGKNANDWGIYDMHGNVWEWCWDYYDYNYYDNSPGTNPVGPAAGERRIIRGGCCLDGENYCRSSNRTYFDDNEKRFGIRLVRNK